jgi:hypothetical protein
MVMTMKNTIIWNVTVYFLVEADQHSFMTLVNFFQKTWHHISEDNSV